MTPAAEDLAGVLGLDSVLLFVAARWRAHITEDSRRYREAWLAVVKSVLGCLEAQEMAETTLMEAKAGGWDLTRAQGWKQPLTLSVEDAVQQANREHVAARQGWSVADQREMSEQARARAHTERTSRYGEEPDYGKH